MHHLVGSTPTLLLAALLLVVVASLPALPALTGRLARLPVVVCLVAIAGGATGFWVVLRYSRVLPEQFPYKVVRYAAAELQRAKAPNVVVIEGASYALSAVDTELLEAELATLGYEVHAVRIASAAANHFERHQMQRCTLDRLEGARDPRQHWVFLAEIQLGYDTQPLAQFVDNQDTARTYHYTTLENGWYAVQALKGVGVEEPKDEWRWPLLRHVLINGFNAGVLTRLLPEDAIELSTGAVNNRLPNSKFKFRGLTRVLDGASHPVPKDSLPSWLFDVREPRTRRLWQGYLDELVYFGVPSTAPEQMSHISGFCAATQVKCIAPDQELLSALDDKTYWRNAGHVSFRGAKIYSLWLARALAKSGALKK
jgi:hypothetical protein